MITHNDPVTIPMNVELLGGYSDLIVESRYFGSDLPEARDCPASGAELEIDTIKCAGYAVDEYLDDNEFDDLKVLVDVELRSNHE